MVLAWQGYMNKGRGGCALAAPILVLCLFFIRSPAIAQGPSTVEVDAVLQEEDVVPTIELVGTVMPVRRSTIGSAVDGRVSTFEVDAGQRVADGETLATLLPNTIRIEIVGAKAELDVRIAELEEMQNGARPEELAQAEAQLASAKAIESFAKSKFERLARLSGSAGALSVEELDSARSIFDSAEQRRLEAESALALLKEGTRVEQIKQAEAKRDVQQQVVNLLTDREAKYTLRSPFDGYVVREFTEKGAWVRQGDPVAEVIDISEVEIEVAVPEQALPFLTLETKVLVTINAFPGRAITGTLSRVVPDADLRARTFPVKVRVANDVDDAVNLIRPGMLARVHLPSGKATSGTTVSKDAVVINGARKTVYKVVDQKALVVPVEIVFGSSNRFLVTGDLKNGDLVVTRGNERLRPDAEVIIIDNKQN